jgi:hypothetical protein
MKTSLLSRFTTVVLLLALGHLGAPPAFALILPTPSPASNLVATPTSSSEVALTWEPSGGSTYWIRRTGPDGNTFDIGVTFSSSFRDRAVAPDTTYTYSVVVEVDYPGGRSFTAPVTATCHTPGWLEQDIGQVGAAGSLQRNGDVITVTGSGADIWGGTDAFHFAAQPWTGDGTMIVRVNSVADTAQWAKAGVMFRESLAPGSRFVMACVNPKGDGALTARATTDGTTDLGISVYTYTPQWLRLVRSGDTFQAFQSRDGVEWTLIGSTTVAMSSTIYAGLAVTSHNEGTPCAAVFDGFNLSPTWDGGGGTATNLTATGASNARISTTWSNTITGAMASLVEVSHDNFHTWTTTVDASASSQMIYGLDPSTTYYVRVRPIFPDGIGLSSAIVSATTQPLPPNTTPAAPTALSAHAVASSQVNLMWADNSDNETGFIVERSTDGTNFIQAASTFANTNSVEIPGLAANTTYYFRVRAVHYGSDVDFQTISSGYSNLATAMTFLTPTGSPYNVQQPRNSASELGLSLYVATGAAGGPNTFQWLRNGAAIAGATSSSYSVGSVQPADTGIYTAVITNGGGSVSTDPAIAGLNMSQKVAGAAHEVGHDIHHPNGNIYDQVLLDGPAASITADAGQVTRISYIDLNDDIVQVEFSGAGTLSITLDNASGPAPAVKYNQPDVSYMKGHATIVIANANETTNVSVFTVGRANAVNQSLFREGESYDGMADLALLAIMSVNGRFGGIYTGNAHYFATRSLTGIFAPNVQFGSRVAISDITAQDTATPMLWLGQATDVRVAGGNLAQPTGRPVQVGMFSSLQFVDGATSDGRILSAQTIQARLERNGADVTAEMTSRTSP